MIPIRIPIILPAAIGVAAWLFVFWPVLFGDKIYFYGDLTQYFIPLLHFQRTELLAGRIPLWNPWILCGTPFFGNPQAWPLYPSSGLLSVLSAERAVGIFGALHCLWAMLGAGLFLRRRGVGEWSAAFGALAFGLGGALVSKCQFPNMVQAASWLPWLLWGIEGAVQARGVPKLALCIGLSALSAHPQMTWMQALLCLAWVAFRRPNRATLGRLALATVLGGMLAAGQLLPVVGATLDSVRPSLSLGATNRFYLPLRQALSAFVFPNYFGNPVSEPPYWGRGNFWEPCAYAGLLPFGLALAALRRGKTSPEIRFWAVTSLVTVWLALGRTGLLYSLAFYVVPGVRQFHDPARFLHLATFGLAMLGAHGLERWKLRPVVLVGLLALAALDLSWFARTLNPTIPQRSFRAEVARLHGTVEGAARVSHNDEVKIIKTYVDYKDSGAGGDPARVVSSGISNTLMLVGVRDAGGYEPVRRKDYSDLSGKVASGVTDQLSWSPESGPTRRPVPGPSRVTFNGTSLQVASETANRVEIALPEAHSGGALVLRDVYAPGWRARIDGQEAPIERAEKVFRQVSVRSGARRVAFLYEPTPVRVGLFLTMLGVGALAFLFAVGDNGANVRFLFRR